ncbi:MAG: hypothetical protein KKD11_03880 [Candidatus Omnitrophica bacterium]|nr:hypothetical protein [Candidatus Omnitrophota bacterium]
MQAYYPKPALERAMKVQDVILRAIVKKILWCEAAEILGISCRQIRRIKQKYETNGYRVVEVSSATTFLATY